MRRRRSWLQLRYNNEKPAIFFITAFVILINCFSSIVTVTGEVQIQRISDRVVPVPGGNVKGVIAAITDDGPLRGRLVEQFYGIQYASVPERFLPPERPTDQWEGNRILWNPAPACPVPEYGGGVDDLRRAGYNRVARARLEPIISASKIFDGDMYDWESTCLKMNIFVPYENRTTNPNLRTKLRAVLMFIPAESYQFGSANAYNPSPLVAFGDIVVVTLNIRHGALGFLASGDQSSVGAPGNMALFDVVSALHWIRANIAAFGGDPHRITLLGHQHAAALVHLLMASPVVRGNRLFQRSILQGGSALSPYAIQSLAAAQSSMFSLGFAAGCSEPLIRQVPVLMKCLRNKTVQHLANLNLKQPGLDDSFQPLISNFGPTITSGNLLSVDLQELNEKRLPYDVLLGASSHSGADLVPEECLSARGCNSTDRMRIIKLLVKIVFHESRRRIIDVLAHQYKDHRRPDAPDAVAAELTKLLGDSYVVAPLIKTANIQANKGRGNTVFFYVFDYGQSPISNGTTTTAPVTLPGEELAYVFGAPLVSNLPPYSNRKFFPEERFLSETMMTYWANFVKTGNPNTANPKTASWMRTSMQNRDEVSWPAYTTESREFLRLGAQVEPDQRYKADMMALWLDLIPRLHSDNGQNGNNGNGNSDYQPPLFPPPPPMPPPPMFLTEPASSEIQSPVPADFNTQPPTTQEPAITPTPRGSVKPSKIPDSMVFINPDSVEATSSEKTGVTKSATAETPPSVWVPILVNDGAEDLPNPATTVFWVRGPDSVNTQLIAGLPLPLVVTVAIISLLIIGNIFICTIVYCVRRKRRQQGQVLVNMETGSKKSSTRSRTPPPPSGKPLANGSVRHMNGTSPLHAGSGKYPRGTIKTPDEIRPLHPGDVDFRGSMRQFGSPLETQIDTPSTEDVSKTTAKQRQQHQQQLSAALNNSANQRPILSPGIALNGIRAEKCNSSGRLSVSMEDLTCSTDEASANSSKQPGNGYLKAASPSPPPRPRPSTSNRSLLMRRNSLPKQFNLHGLDGDKRTPQTTRSSLAQSSNVLDQHCHHQQKPQQQPNGSCSTMPRPQPPQQTPSERELAPISAIRLVNHSRIVTPPSSSSASASAASPPTSSSSAMSPSPQPPPLPGGNPGNKSKQSLMQEPAVCFLPAYRTPSGLDTNTPSPISMLGFQMQDRALPPPPPPPKPRQLMARFNPYSQQDDESYLLDANGRPLPPSPPLESSTPPPIQRQLPPTPPQAQPRNSLMTNWSKVAGENSVVPSSISPKKVTLGSSRVTGL